MAFRQSLVLRMSRTFMRQRSTASFWRPAAAPTPTCRPAALLPVGLSHTQLRNFAAPTKAKKKKKKKGVVEGIEIPKEDVEWVLSFLEPEWEGDDVELEPEDAERLTVARKAYQAHVGRENRRMDGELHRLIKLRKKALAALPEDLRELALRDMKEDEPLVRLPTWTPPDKLYR